MSTIPAMQLKQWSMLLFLSLLWGASFFFMKVALAELPTFTIILLRVSLAALALFIYLTLTKSIKLHPLAVWKLFFYLALFNNVIPFALILYGMTELASGLASILNAATPLFTICVAHFATNDEKLSVAKFIGIALGIVGVAILIGAEMVLGISTSLLATIACLGACLSYAFASIIGRQFKQYQVEPKLVAFGQVLTSTVILLPITLFIDQPWAIAAPSVDVMLSVLALGTLSTAFAYVLYFKLIAQAGATNAVLVTLLVPVSAVVLGYLVLNESLGINHFLGMAFIALGLLVIDGRLYRKIRAA